MTTDSPVFEFFSDLSVRLPAELGQPVREGHRAFNQKRADWSGLIEHGFAWGDPAKETEPAVHRWLGCALPH